MRAEATAAWQPGNSSSVLLFYLLKCHLRAAIKLTPRQPGWFPLTDSFLRYTFVLS